LPKGAVHLSAAVYFAEVAARLSLVLFGSKIQYSYYSTKVLCRDGANRIICVLHRC